MGELPGPYATTGTYFPERSDVIKEMNKKYGIASFYIHGWFIIKNNADVTLEAYDCVELTGGFTVENGAVFEVKPNK